MNERVSNEQLETWLSYPDLVTTEGDLRKTARDLLDAREQLEDRDTVPRSRYNACNSDWLEAKATAERVRKTATEQIEKAERERDEARLVIREFLASGVEHDDPRMDYITMQVDRVTIDAARAAAKGGEDE